MYISRYIIYSADVNSFPSQPLKRRLNKMYDYSSKDGTQFLLEKFYWHWELVMIIYLEGIFVLQKKSSVYETTNFRSFSFNLEIRTTST